VWVGNNKSTIISLSTGSPQGCVLFTLMTHDCCAKSRTNNIRKYENNTTVVGLIQNGGETICRVVQDNLALNVEKNKEMVIDFRINFYFVNNLNHSRINM